MACDSGWAMGRILVLLLVARLCLSSSLPHLEFEYHNHKEMTEYLQHVSKAHPFITTMYSIGKSVQGRELWVLEVTAAAKSRLGVPDVKLVGNIHGNEPVGNEIILHLIQFLISNYPSNETVAWLLNNTRLHLLPSLNPDGFVKATEGTCTGETGRHNAKHMDLNRNFPDAFHENSKPRQKETIAVQSWLKSRQFVLSAALHGGALLANYPYDNLGPHRTSEDGQQSLTPDNDVFVHLASSYASTHPTMHKGQPCPPSERVFPGGFINGAEWFSSPGGMSDYNYAYHGCLDLTLEIGCCKYPNAGELPKYWEQNKEAMLEFIGQVHRGVRGIVYDSLTNKPVPGANLTIQGRNNTFRTTGRGEFSRILLPGEYVLHVLKQGYPPATAHFTVLPPDDVRRPHPTWVNVSLSSEPQKTTETSVATASSSSNTPPAVTTADDLETTSTSGESLSLTQPASRETYPEVNLKQSDIPDISRASQVRDKTTVMAVILACLSLSFYF